MKILISGSSGLVGSTLTEALFKEGHTITCLQRNKEKTDNSKKMWLTEKINPDSDPFDVVIHLAGENIGQGLWTKKKKKKIIESRILGTKELIDFLVARNIPPKTFLCASAVGFYGNCGSKKLDETQPQGVGFLADICNNWEAEANRLKEHGSRVITMRFGMVLSPKGGALKKMLPSFKAGMGGKIGSGNQHISWISIRDITRIVPFLIENNSVSGPVNIVAPSPCTNLDLTKELGKAVNKPAVLAPPIWLLKLLLGKEMVEEMLLTSTQAIPKKLIDSGYKFVDTDLAQTLRYCIEQ